MTGPVAITCAAIVLAGGRGSRLGGVRKAEVDLAGHRLVDVVCDACAGCDPVVVVGHEDLEVPSGVVRTREEPAYAGPAAALAAGLEALDAQGACPDWVLCLGCDQPGAPVVVPALVQAAATTPDEVEAIAASSTASEADDDAGPRIEWMLSILRRDALDRAVAECRAERGPDALVDASMRRLLSGLGWMHTSVPAGATDDIDTWDDHARWQNRTMTT